MKKGTTYAIATTTLFYMSIGLIGYSAFGNQVAGNLLTGFGFYNPFWLLDIANAAVVVHLFGAYQVTPPRYFYSFGVMSTRNGWKEDFFLFFLFLYLLISKLVVPFWQ